MKTLFFVHMIVDHNTDCEVPRMLRSIELELADLELIRDVGESAYISSVETVGMIES